MPEGARIEGGADFSRKTVALSGAEVTLGDIFSVLG
jgi:hypothetical protein